MVPFEGGCLHKMIYAALARLLSVPVVWRDVGSLVVLGYSEGHFLIVRGALYFERCAALYSNRSHHHLKESRNTSETPLSGTADTSLTSLPSGSRQCGTALDLGCGRL